MNRTFSFLPIVMLSSIVSGCITAPYHETVYSSGNTDRVVTFSGYLDEPGEAVSLQAFVDGRWEEFATTESASSGMPMGWTNVPYLYSWQVSTEVGDGGEYWEPNETVRIRVQREDGDILVGFHSWSEVSCTTQTGGTVEQAYGSCVGAPITEVHLVDVD